MREIYDTYRWFFPEWVPDWYPLAAAVFGGVVATLDIPVEIVRAFS